MKSFLSENCMLNQTCCWHDRAGKNSRWKYIWGKAKERTKRKNHEKEEDNQLLRIRTIIYIILRRKKAKIVNGYNKLK